jgi:hypothetical protein
MDGKFLPSSLKRIPIVKKVFWYQNGSWWHKFFNPQKSISVARWMDRKPVFMMSNFTDPTNMTKMTRKLKNAQAIQLRCPVMIQVYNYGKTWVDRTVQRIQYYTVDRKSNRDWLHIFFHYRMLLSSITETTQMTIWNACSF